MGLLHFPLLLKTDFILPLATTSLSFNTRVKPESFSCKQMLGSLSLFGVAFVGSQKKVFCWLSKRAFS